MKYWYKANKEKDSKRLKYFKKLVKFDLEHFSNPKLA